MSKSRFAILSLGVITVALAVTLAWSLIRSVGLREKADKFDRRCSKVRLAMRQAWQHLENPALQGEAARRFLEPVALQSYDEVEMCAVRQLDLEGHTQCQLRGDYACLAKLARAAEQAIPE